MIASEIEFEQTRQQLAQLEEAMADLRSRVYASNPRRFGLMAESYVAEIERLRDLIDEYLGIRLARIASTDLTVIIGGESVASGTVPTRLLNRITGALQRGVLKIGEYIARTNRGEADQLPRRIFVREFELDVVAIGSGSFEICLNLVDPPDTTIPGDFRREALKRLSEALQHASALDVQRDVFRHLIPDLNFQLQVLQALKDIAPSRRRPEYDVEFRGRFLPEGHVSFNARTRSYLSELIRTQVREATQEGPVREINLDKRTFQIRADVTNLRCKYPSDLEERVKNALGKRVRVRGRASINLDGSIRHLNVSDLQELEN